MSPLPAPAFRVAQRFSLSFLLPLLLMALSAGCGGHSTPADCSGAGALSVAPATATADHLAAAPGNKISFVAGGQAPAGFPPTPGPIRLGFEWSVFYPPNVTIGNTQHVDH